MVARCVVDTKPKSLATLPFGEYEGRWTGAYIWVRIDANNSYTLQADRRVKGLSVRARVWRDASGIYAEVLHGR